MAINIMAAFEQEPPQLDFVFNGFLAGTVGALVAPGATGKSFLALQAAFAVAGGAGADLLGLTPKHTGKVAYFAGEDPENVLINRLHSLGHHIDPAARERVADGLILEPVMGNRINVMDEATIAALVKGCADCRLIVFDTLSRIHQLDENSNGDMARLVGVLEYIAKTTGAAILYLHHVNKGSAREGQGDQQQAARGASALIDNARWCGYVAKMTPDEAKQYGMSDDQGLYGLHVRYGVSKQNYGQPTPEKWFKRSAGGVLLPVELVKKSTTGGRKKGDFHD